MIAGCYSIDLYCDCNKCSMGAGRTPRFQFTGETWRECAKKAKAGGWVIMENRQTCYAPNHQPIICKACDCPIDEDGCGCNPHDA